MLLGPAAAARSWVPGTIPWRGEFGVEPAFIALAIAGIISGASCIKYIAFLRFLSKLSNSYGSRDLAVLAANSRPDGVMCRPVGHLGTTVLTAGLRPAISQVGLRADHHV